jgi:lipid-A-disaccharide synthase-like uncharacterized protein
MSDRLRWLTVMFAAAAVAGSIQGCSLADLPWQSEKRTCLIVVRYDPDSGEAAAEVMEGVTDLDQQPAGAGEAGTTAAFRLDLESGRIDPVDAGLSWYWLAFGFGAQALFSMRFLVQWIASEREKRSVVPGVFWVLSLVGGLMLAAYFLRRGDPVGIVGQLGGIVIYSRNLVFLRRARRKAKPADGPPQADDA